MLFLIFFADCHIHSLSQNFTEILEFYPLFNSSVSMCSNQTTRVLRSVHFSFEFLLRQPYSTRIITRANSTTYLKNFLFIVAASIKKELWPRQPPESWQFFQNGNAQHQWQSSEYISSSWYFMPSMFLHYSTFIPRNKDDIVLVFRADLGLDNSSRFVLYEGKELLCIYT